MGVSLYYKRDGVEHPSQTIPPLTILVLLNSYDDRRKTVTKYRY